MSKHNLRNLSLNRFSAVSSPAQKGAVKVLLKSAGNAAEVETIAGAPAATTESVEQTRKDETLDTEDSTMEKTVEEQMAAVQGRSWTSCNKVIVALVCRSSGRTMTGWPNDNADAYLAKRCRGSGMADIRGWQLTLIL